MTCLLEKNRHKLLTGALVAGAMLAFPVMASADNTVTDNQSTTVTATGGETVFIEDPADPGSLSGAIPTSASGTAATTTTANMGTIDTVDTTACGSAQCYDAFRVRSTEESAGSWSLAVDAGPLVDSTYDPVTFSLQCTTTMNGTLTTADNTATTGGECLSMLTSNGTWKRKANIPDGTDTNAADQDQVPSYAGTTLYLDDDASATVVSSNTFKGDLSAELPASAIRGMIPVYTPGGSYSREVTWTIS